MPVAVSSSIGEHHEGVKKVGTKIMAKFGKAWRSGKRARAKQSARRHLERVDTHAGIMDTRGHHVNSDLGPT